jgi:transposase-like protein
MLPNVKQATIAPLLKASIVPGTLIYTDEYIIYSPLSQWGYDHKSVCHGKGEYARSGGWRRILRSPCQYYGRLLVVTAVLVQTTPRYFSREVASISGQLHRLFTTLENEVKHYFQLF